VSGLLFVQATCRMCAAGLDETTVLRRLREVPVAGVYVASDDPGPDPRGPLSFCRCGACGLVQLAEALAPSFYRQYRFVSGIGTAYREHLARVADAVARLTPAGRVLEVGASDGTLLGLLRERGVLVSGFEPSAVAAEARGRGLPVVEGYFDGAAGSRSPLSPVDVVIVRHVLEHLHDFGPFFEGLAAVTHPGSVVIVEVPDLGATVDACNVGNIYHPHACYFDVATLRELFSRNGWRLRDVSVVPIFGGSLLALGARGGSAPPGPWAPLGVPTRNLSQTALEGFVAAWEGELAAVLEFVRVQRQRGRRVAGYGAAERTGAVVGMCGISTEDVECLYDRNPALVGLALGGSRIPIRDPSRILQDRPDLLVLFARSFEEEIVASLAAFRKEGGRFATLRTRPPSVLA
jgi:SAM-dependent methyltransferase